MAAISNLFSIEDSIVTQLGLIAGVSDIYREAVDEGINEQTIATPSLYVISKGILAGQSAVRVKHQKVITLWEIGVCCKKANYKTVGGVKIIEVMGNLNGYQAADWINPARLVPSNDKSEPLYRGSLAYYPLLFEVEIII